MLLPALLCLFLPSRPAGAGPLLHGVTTLLACSEPRPSRRMPVHRGVVAGDRCFVVSPDQGWERIGARNGLLLMRRTPPAIGEPPLFFRPGDVAGGPTRRLPLPALHHPQAGPLLLLLGTALAAVAANLRRIGRRATRWHRRARALRVVSAEIAAQRDRLQVRRLQLVSSDGYGTVRLEKWQQEKRYFCRTRLLPLLASRRLDGYWAGLEAGVQARIERAASGSRRPRIARAAASDPRVFDPGMDPIDYEHHCAILLRRSGWDAQVTAASGDQGADVLATRNGATLVVQCKLYRGAVGNASVQQASAARLHHRARHAAVVSNARFTASAVALARTNRVHLLHHEELERFSPEAG